MKIITRKRFMELPAGAICCEGEPWAFGGWFRKDDNCGTSDYFATSLDWLQFVGANSPDDIIDAADAAIATGVSLEMHFASGERDDCFDESRIYCVLEDADIDVLISRLTAGKGKATNIATNTGSKPW